MFINRVRKDARKLVEEIVNEKIAISSLEHQGPEKDYISQYFILERINIPRLNTNFIFLSQIRDNFYDCFIAKYIEVLS